MINQLATEIIMVVLYQHREPSMFLHSDTDRPYASARSFGVLTI